MTEKLTAPGGRRLVGVIVIAAASACVADHDPALFTGMDDVGVPTVESMSPSWSDGEGWSVGPEPSIVIGSIAGDAEYQFTRIVSAFRVADGRVVIVDGPSGSVRFFDAKGQFEHAFGGIGDGPGDFAYPSEAFPYRGDSIAVWDDGRRQIAIIDSGGAIGRRVTTYTRVGTVRGPGGSVSFGWGGRVVGSFPDGTFVIDPDVSLQADPGTIVSYHDEPMRFSAQGEVLNGLGRYPTGASFVTDMSALGTGRPPSLPVPYARSLAMAVRGNHLYVGADPDHRVRILAPSGELVRVIRATHRDLALGRSDIAAYKDQQRKRMRDGDFGSGAGVTPGGLETALDGLSFPKTIPPFTAIRVDSEGFVWTLHQMLPEGTDPRVWSVFGRDGRLLGEVTTPADMVVKEIGKDYVLGIVTDEFDVPTVAIYPLDRSRPRPTP